MFSIVSGKKIKSSNLSFQTFDRFLLELAPIEGSGLTYRKLMHSSHVLGESFPFCTDEMWCAESAGVVRKFWVASGKFGFYTFVIMVLQNIICFKQPATILTISSCFGPTLIDGKLILSPFHLLEDNNWRSFIFFSF